MWQKVILASEIPKGSSACVTINQWQIAVYHRENGNWFAVQNICPHNEEKVLFVGNIFEENGDVIVECPLHGQQYSVKSGKHIQQTPGFDLQTYLVYCDGEYVYLDVS